MTRLLLALALVIAACVHQADAVEMNLRQPGCYPPAAYVWRWTVRDGPDAIYWVCDEPAGLKDYWRTGEYGGAQQVALAELMGFAFWPADQATFTKPSTEAELEVVTELIREAAPRCYTRLSGTATVVPVYGRNADGTRGPRRTGSNGLPMSIAPDTRTGCIDRLTMNARYCQVWNKVSTAGQVIPADSWALCRVEKAPAAGWS